MKIRAKIVKLQIHETLQTNFHEFDELQGNTYVTAIKLNTANFNLFKLAVSINFSQF